MQNPLLGKMQHSAVADLEMGSAEPLSAILIQFLRVSKISEVQYDQFDAAKKLEVFNSAMKLEKLQRTKNNFNHSLTCAARLLISSIALLLLASMTLVPSFRELLMRTLGRDGSETFSLDRFVSYCTLSGFVVCIAVLGDSLAVEITAAMKTAAKSGGELFSMPFIVKATVAASMVLVGSRVEDAVQGMTLVISGVTCAAIWLISGCLFSKEGKETFCPWIKYLSGQAPKQD